MAVSAIAAIATLPDGHFPQQYSYKPFRPMLDKVVFATAATAARRDYVLLLRSVFSTGTYRYIPRNFF